MCRACAKLNVTTKNGERNECLWHVAQVARFEGAFFFWATRADSFLL